MGQRDDSTYFELRIAQERKRASDATNPAVSRAHLSMIAEYEQRIRATHDGRQNIRVPQ